MIWMLLFMNLWAQDVLVQAPGTADVFFEKSRMKRPKAISFVEHQLKDTEGFDKEIIAELKKAQFQFLQGSLDKAKEHYHNIQDRQHEQPWTQKAQQIIHYSLLRLAQLETNEKKKHYWLEKAWLFSYEMPIDSKLFPPPLVQKYRELAKSNPPQVWALPKNGAEYDRILINGAEQKLAPTLLGIPEEKFKLASYRTNFIPFTCFRRQRISKHRVFRSICWCKETAMTLRWRQQRQLGFIIQSLPKTVMARWWLLKTSSNAQLPCLSIDQKVPEPTVCFSRSGFGSVLGLWRQVWLGRPLKTVTGLEELLLSIRKHHPNQSL